MHERCLAATMQCTDMTFLFCGRPHASRPWVSGHPKPFPGLGLSRLPGDADAIAYRMTTSSVTPAGTTTPARA